MVVKILPQATMLLHSSSKRKSSPETPLSATTRSENDKLKKTLKAMNEFEKRRERFAMAKSSNSERALISGDTLNIHSSTMKGQIEVQLKTITMNLDMAVKKHNKNLVGRKKDVGGNQNTHEEVSLCEGGVRSERQSAANTAHSRLVASLLFAFYSPLFVENSTTTRFARRQHRCRFLIAGAGQV